MTRHTTVSGLPLEGPALLPGSYAVPAQRSYVPQVWQAIRRYGLLLGTIVFLAVLATLISQLSATPIYQATAVVQVELNDEKGLPDAAARNKERVANEAGLYNSRSLAERVVRDLNLPYDPRFTSKPLSRNEAVEPHHITRAAGTLTSMTDVTADRSSDFITIKVRSASAELASEIANQYVPSLRELRAEIRDSQRASAVRDLEQQRSRLAAEARQAEQALADFRQANRMLVGAGGEEDYQQLNRMALEAASANAMRAAQSARAGGISNAMSYRSTAGATSALLDQQQRRLDELNREKSDLSVTYGAQHPKIQSIDAQISETSGALAQEQQRVAAAASARAAAEAARESGIARSEAAAASARSGVLQGQVRSMIGKAYANTANMVELNALQRRAEAAREAYLATAKRSQEVQSGIEAEGIHSSLVSPAPVPREPVSPRPKSATFAAFAGSLVLGLLLIAAIELTDNRLWNADQVARLFGLPTFGMLPEVSKSLMEAARANPVLLEPQSLFAEVGRGIAAEVMDLARQGRTHTVLVTSPVMGDGKSTVAVTLAAAAAAAGRRAVVVDLDLRRPGSTVVHPVQAQHEQQPHDQGDLVDYLTGSADVAKLLPSAAAPDEGQLPDSYQPVILSAHTSVRNPAALMRVGRINRLLAELHQQFDLIVINAPAALATRDARTLTEVADSVLLVVRWGKTTIEQFRATLQALQEQVDGVVFNRVDYAEHARRGYGDSVQFYMDSAGYYAGDVPQRTSWLDRLKEAFTKTPSGA